jgi:acyl carrier protein
MNNQMDSVTHLLCGFIAERTGMESIDRTMDLLGSSVLDSLMVMGVVAFVEQQFQIRMEPSDIRPATFRTIDTLAEWVASHQSKAA